MNKGTLFLLVVLQIGLLNAQNSTSVTANSGATAPDYAALQARSAALSPADRERAKQLFATSFSLWQSGDFAAAEIGLKQGLDLDPANALANYYYGDCLVRRKDKVEARGYLTRAVEFGATTVEALKAQAELQTLSVIPTSIVDMTPDEIKSVALGAWSLNVSCPWAGSHYTAQIKQIDAKGAITGLKNYDFMNKSTGGHIDGDQITFEFGRFSLTGHVTSRNQMSGVGTRSAASCKWTDEKQ